LQYILPKLVRHYRRFLSRDRWLEVCWRFLTVLESHLGHANSPGSYGTDKRVRDLLIESFLRGNFNCEDPRDVDAAWAALPLSMVATIQLMAEIVAHEVLQDEAEVVAVSGKVRACRSCRL
jgi:hypothetical protein